MRALTAVLLLLIAITQYDCTNECEEACVRIKECVPLVASVVGCCQVDECEGKSKCVAECVLDLLGDSCDGAPGIYSCVAQCEP
jgi:hypothetical protein